jgi:hypothetical protein
VRWGLRLSVSDLSFVFAIAVGAGARVEVIERLKLGIFLEKYPALDPPRQRLTELVLNELGSGETKYVVKFLQSSLFSFRYPEEDHHQGNDVETGVQAESTLYEYE